MSKHSKILVVDDDPGIRSMCEKYLAFSGYHCITLGNGQMVNSVIEAEHPDLVVLDQELPDVYGIDVLKEIRANHPKLIVIMLTACHSIDFAVRAIKIGADDFLTKPLVTSELLNRIKHFLDNQQPEIHHEIDSLELNETDFANMVGQSLAMKKVFTDIRNSAPTDTNILIQGESGTGKELAAQAIHRYSKRANKPFLPIDCTTFSDALIESELFGYVKEAFSGVNQDRMGLLESANGGTVFLDEITELSMAMQVKLLRVLQERQVRRLGGTEFSQLDIRIISSTNTDPIVAMTENRLRHDLYYRLNVIPIVLPPLRERGNDISLLADYFLQRFNAENEKSIHDFMPKALKVLRRYKWPGNVRELQNLVERLVVLGNGEDAITVNDIPLHIRTPNIVIDQTHIEDLSFKEAKRNLVRQFERQYMANLMEEFNGNISLAAKKAGIDRKTFHRILKENEN